MSLPRSCPNNCVSCKWNEIAYPDQRFIKGCDTQRCLEHAPNTQPPVELCVPMSLICVCPAFERELSEEILVCASDTQLCRPQRHRHPIATERRDHDSCVAQAGIAIPDGGGAISVHRRN